MGKTRKAVPWAGWSKQAPKGQTDGQVCIVNVEKNVF